jgi:hypothetical protein
MALWGVTDADESKPKWLSDADKKNTIAKPEGWVLKKTVGSRNLEEILVATGADLATGIGQADITHVDFVNTTYSEAAPGAFSTSVTFNENVTVSGTPRLQVTNSQAGGGSAAAWKGNYASGTGSNVLIFTSTLNAGDAAEDDVLSIGANAMELNGGTVVDTVAGGNSTITSSAAIGTAAGTITVVA